MGYYTNGKAGMPQPGLDAGRDGRDVFGYVNDKTGINTEQVLEDTTFLHTLEADEKLVVTQAWAHLATDSDNVTFEFVVTENGDGTGAVTVITGKWRLATGTSTTQAQPTTIPLDPPLVLTRDDGGAFSAQVLGNDANTSLYLQYRGWTEAK